MARISTGTIERVREADIVDVVGRYVRLKKAGANWTGCCPFHNEKTASFTVSGAKGIFKCFGCGESGGVIDFVMKVENISEFPEAVEKAAALCGINVEYESESEKESEERKVARASKEEMLKVLGVVGEFFARKLWTHPYLPQEAGQASQEGMTETGELPTPVSQPDKPVANGPSLAGGEPVDGASGGSGELTTSPAGAGTPPKNRRRAGENVGFSYLLGRGYDELVCAEWGIGWAPNDWKSLAGFLKEKGMVAAAIKAGVLKEKEGGEPFCRFKGRVMFPIHDRNGRIISFSGRVVPGVDYGEKEQAKYINGPETAVYVKSRVLYGLHKAVKSLKEWGWGVLVEGNTDVISMHQAGATNTVGTCGTALTPEHVKMMMRECQEWVLMRDGDAAGTKALLRDIPIMLGSGMKVLVYELEGGMDPDGFARAESGERERVYGASDAHLPQAAQGYSSLAGGESLDGAIEDPSAALRVTVRRGAKDAIVWFAEWQMKRAGDDRHAKSRAVGEVVDLLAYVQDEVLRGEYFKEVAEILGMKKADLGKLVNAKAKVVEVSLDEAEDDKFPEWAADKKDEAMQWGFVERRDAKHVGYYFLGESQSLKQMTFYVLNPLYHIYSSNTEENRRMFEVDNGYDKMVVEVASKSTLSVEQFSAALISEGVFVPDGSYSKIQHLKLMRKLMQQMPKTYELTSLGWQHEEGFWAFANKIYVPSYQDGVPGQFFSYNEYGVAEINGKHYYSPGASKALDMVRKSENIYENDLYLTYKESPIDFSRWCTLMVDTYDESGKFAIPFVIATIFRDIVIENAPIPFLYAYGIINSGKSQYGESVSNFFFSGLDSQGELYKPFNLNQGTVASFFDRMGRFNNCPNVLNEFDENFIEEDFFRGIKAGYDGEGRTKMMKEKKKSITQKISCSIVLMGQYLSTKDENSVLSRSIPRVFQAVAQPLRSEKQMAGYTELKKLEKKGINGILVEILNKRAYFKNNFPEVLHLVMKRMQDDLKKEECYPQPRILKNVAMMAAIVEVCAGVFRFPFTAGDFYELAKKTVKEFSGLMNRTSGVSDFWNMVEFLLDRGVIQEGVQFIVEDKVERVKLLNAEKKPYDHELPGGENLIFIRISVVHPLYMQEQRKGTGKTALNEATLLTYLTQQEYYVGQMKAKKFSKGANSCYVFKYDALNVNLKREKDMAGRSEVVIKGEVTMPPQKVSLEGKYKFGVKETVHLPTGIPGRSGTTVHNYQCFTENPACLQEVMKGHWIQIKGLLEVTGEGNFAQRILDVVDYECVVAGGMYQKQFVSESGERSAESVEDLPF